MDKALRTYALFAEGRSKEITIKRYCQPPNEAYYVTHQSDLHY